jgi:hypothetical protein
MYQVPQHDRLFRCSSRTDDGHEGARDPSGSSRRTTAPAAAGAPTGRCNRQDPRVAVDVFTGLLHLPIPAAIPPAVPSRHVGQQENDLDRVSA